MFNDFKSYNQFHWLIYAPPEYNVNGQTAYNLIHPIVDQTDKMAIVTGGDSSNLNYRELNITEQVLTWVAKAGDTYYSPKYDGAFMQSWSPICKVTDPYWRGKVSIDAGLVSQLSSIRPEMWQQLLLKATSFDIMIITSVPPWSDNTAAGGATYTIDSFQTYFGTLNYSSAPVNIVTSEKNTAPWAEITGVSITGDEPEGTKIRIGVYSGAYQRKILAWNASGKYWASCQQSDLLDEGMSMEDILKVPLSAWNMLIGGQLKFYIAMQASASGVTPTFSMLRLDHTSRTFTPTSNLVQTYTPSTTYEQWGWNRELDKYILEIQEGIGFEDVENENSFYTTPNKVYVRSLELGQLLGAVQTRVYAAEVANTYRDKSFDVELTMGVGGKKAEPGLNCCYLPDATSRASQTVGEFSYTEDPFEPVYPLTMQIGPQKDQVFYFRITPNTITSGDVSAQITATVNEIIK